MKTERQFDSQSEIFQLTCPDEDRIRLIVDNCWTTPDFGLCAVCLSQPHAVCFDFSQSHHEDNQNIITKCCHRSFSYLDNITGDIKDFQRFLSWCVVRL